MSKLYSVAMLVCAVFLAGCEAEVGSKAWCSAMDEKSKADWTANEALDYGENCIVLPGQ
jgi:hypothetical protein